MRALLIATGYNSNLRPLIFDRPTGLFNVIDKTILHHIIEHLQPQGIHTFDLILSHKPEMIEKEIGDGKRWGITVHYHLVKEEERPFKTLLPMIQDWEEEILLGSSFSLPMIAIKNLSKGQPICFMMHNQWTGWAYTPKKKLLNLPHEIEEREIYSFFMKNKGKSLPTKMLLSSNTFRELQQSNINVLNADHPQLIPPTTAKELAKGMWISHAVTVDPTAKLTPPLFIGEHTQIGPLAIVGPNAIIENHSVIEGKTTIENSLICQRSYLGEGLIVRDCIIDRSTLINLNYKTQVTLGESFILGDLHPQPIKRMTARFFTICIASLLLLLFSPLIFLMYFLSDVDKEEILQIPASTDPKLWKICYLYTFKDKGFTGKDPRKRFLHRLPLLLNVIKGDIQFTGVPPRTPQEVSSLQEDWRNLYTQAQAGIISLADVELDANPSIEELFTSEAYYAAHQGFSYNLNLCFRWFKRLIMRKLKLK